MGSGSRVFVLLVAGLLWAVVACGDEASGDSVIATIDPATVFGGQPVAEVFATKCASCHGNERQGLVGPALTPERLTHSDDT